MKIILPLASAAVLLFASAAVSAVEVPEAMKKAGCLACHAVDRVPAGAATPAQGPAWRDLAARYKSVKGAQQELTARIMTGSSNSADRGTSYPRHWGAQVSGDFMPSHRSAVTEMEAAQLVAFILALDPQR